MFATYRSPSYRTACKIQKTLIASILTKKLEPIDVSRLIDNWLDLEWAKREWRFIPRLAQHSMKELGDAKAALARRLPHAASDSLIDTEAEPKESLNPQTVPTPPTPKPQERGVDLCNK